MRVYHPKTGEPYTGEPVDCRELMQVAGYTKLPKSLAAKAGDDGRPSREHLDAALQKLPEQVKSGEHKDQGHVVDAMRGFYGSLFTKDDEAAVRALFPQTADLFEDMSKADLKKVLDDRGVTYAVDANKVALLTLVRGIGKRPDETPGGSAKVGAKLSK